MLVRNKEKIVIPIRQLAERNPLFQRSSKGCLTAFDMTFGFEMTHLSKKNKRKSVFCIV